MGLLAKVDEQRSNPYWQFGGALDSLNERLALPGGGAGPHSIAHPDEPFIMPPCIDPAPSARSQQRFSPLEAECLEQHLPVC